MIISCLYVLRMSILSLQGTIFFKKLINIFTFGNRVNGEIYVSILSMVVIVGNSHSKNLGIGRVGWIKMYKIFYKNW